MRALPQTPSYATLHAGVSAIHLADSITGDAHKSLNVPYDCGFFLTRSLDTLTSVFQNPNAAYLSGGSIGDGIPSPLNIGIENSRRFRALPVYAVLVAYGRTQLQAMFEAQVLLARAIAAYIMASKDFDLLNAQDVDKIGVVVLFRAVDDAINKGLVDVINSTQKIMVSGTSWHGKSACRIAISTWRVDVERDLEVVKSVLEQVLLGSETSS